MSQIKKGNLTVSSALFNFINQEVIPGTNIIFEEFWSNFDKAAHELSIVNKILLEKRESIQKKIDKWHIDNKG